MSKDLFQQLKQLKTDPKAGWVSFDISTKKRQELMAAIKNQGSAPLAATAHSGFVIWTFMHSVVRPLSLGFAVFALMAGGWFTTVRAASESLPGDALYGLKLVTERAQLALSSLDKRAVLHTEFAERRLHEVVAMDVQSEYFDQTLAAFRSEINLAGQDLAELKNSDDASVVAVASAIDLKVAQLASGIAGAGNISQEKAQESQQAAQAVADSAVETLVEEHESVQSDDSTLALSRSFKEQYNDLMGRQTFDLGRIAVIENALSGEDVSTAVLGESNIAKLKFAVKDATDSMGQAMSLAGAGGYRAAFDIMLAADTQLLALEAQLAQIEINITAELLAAEEAQRINVDGIEGVEGVNVEESEIENAAE